MHAFTCVARGACVDLVVKIVGCDLFSNQHVGVECGAQLPVLQAIRLCAHTVFVHAGFARTEGVNRIRVLNGLVVVRDTGGRCTE